MINAQDVRRGLFRAALVLVCLCPLALSALSTRGWSDFLRALSLAPTLILAILATTLLEGYGARLPRGRALERFAVVLTICLVWTLTGPALGIQWAYLAAGVGGAGSWDLFTLLAVPVALLASLISVGVPAALVAAPRVRDDRDPIVVTLGVALALSLPLLFLEPCFYPIPALALGAVSLLCLAADGLEGFFFSPHEAYAGELGLRVRAGDLSPEALRLAADLGDAAARRALQLPAELSLLHPSELVARLEGRRPALARAAVLLALEALPSSADPAAVRRACGVLADSIRQPSAESHAQLRQLWSRYPWSPAPEGSSSQRTLHFALAIALAPEQAGPEVLQRSIQSAVAAGLETSTPEDLSGALRRPLAAWILEGTDPFDAVCTA